jgi:hypothetical protein
MANQGSGRAWLRQLGFIGALVAPVAVLLFLSACGTGVDAASTSAPAALVESQTLTVSVPQGTSLQELALLGSDSVRLAPNASVVPATGSVAHVASLGGTNVGVEASIRDG